MQGGREGGREMRQGGRQGDRDSGRQGDEAGSEGVRGRDQSEQRTKSQLNIDVTGAFCAR
jgi:hypothetical protein